MDKLNIDEIIIVEGKHDTARLKLFFNCHTIETNGIDLPNDVLKRIKEAYDKKKIIVFTDPDYVGEKLRKILSSHFPNALHAFITAKEGQGKRNKGIENASYESLKKALEQCVKFDVLNVSISEEEFFSSMYHFNSSRALRQDICEYFKLGYCNNKQFFKRLNALNISFEDFEKVTKEFLNK